MKPGARTLFEGFGYCGKDAVTLNVGAPGPATLKKCAQLMLEATKVRLEKEIQIDAPLLQYGTPQGDPLYIEQLSAFLSAEYKDPVDQSNLVTSAGATNGLHVLLTLLFPQRCPIFVEELTYHLALNMFHDDLQFPIFPVSMDEDGLNLDDLRSQIEMTLKDGAKFPIPDHGYRAVLYSIPTFHNPTGRYLSAEKSKQLVELAHENRLLIITEDVYNLLYYQGDRPPKRLFAYDRERAQALGDSQGGCVISNGTFSKLLTPGLRLGWLELPPWARTMWDKRSTLFSGGSLNMYTSGLVGTAIEMGLVAKFVHDLRVEYKKRRDVMIDKLTNGLPPGCRFETPKGGYFIWIEMPKHIKAARVQEIANKKYKILFQEGPKFCLPEKATKYDHCIRLAISYHEIDILANASEKIASVIADLSKAN